MTIKFRPLTDVKMLLEEAGSDISYAYDDLIFVEHTAYLIQFDDDKPKNLKIYFNTDLNELETVNIQKKLYGPAKSRKMTVSPAGKFSLKQKEGTEEIDISFYPIGN